MILELGIAALKVIWGLLKGASIAKLVAVEAASFSVAHGVQHALTSIGVKSALAKSLGASASLVFTSAVERGLSNYETRFDSDERYDNVYRLRASWPRNSDFSKPLSFAAQLLQGPRITSAPGWELGLPKPRYDYLSFLEEKRCSDCGLHYSYSHYCLNRTVTCVYCKERHREWDIHICKDRTETCPRCLRTYTVYPFYLGLSKLNGHQCPKCSICGDIEKPFHLCMGPPQYKNKFPMIHPRYDAILKTSY